ncbi:MAG: sugar transferase [Anaerolineaceae bacterium]
MAGISDVPLKAELKEVDRPVRRSIGSGLREVLKRTFDICASFIGLVLLSPFLLFIAWRIKADSPGPVIFRGRRTGRNGKEFRMLKFRSMYERPGSYNGPQVTVKGDSRITPLGRWLRVTKINELPQLWNVLTGEMSLVGPRPEDPAIAATWPEDLRRKVLSVRPGVTSPASIIYRNEENLLKSEHVLDDYLRSILPDKLRLDELYVENRNLFSDLDVIFMTLIMLLPRIRDITVPEKVFFSGPLYNFIRRYISWFIVDVITSLIAITITGAFWRISGPLNIGILPALGWAAVMSLLLSLGNTLLGLKKVVWRYASSVHVIDLGLSVIFSLVILWLLDSRIVFLPVLPTRMILDFGILVFCGFVVTRYQTRLITGAGSRWVRMRGRSRAVGERVLVIGAGECGDMAVWLMNKSRYANAFTIVGFADDDFRKQNYMRGEYPILGTTRDIQELVTQHNIGLILFAISDLKKRDRERILSRCNATPARVVTIPDFIDIFKRSLLAQ